MTKRLIVGLAVAASIASWSGAARAQDVLSDFDAMTTRSWRLVVNAPSVRLAAWPLGWSMNGEIGVQFARFNIVAANVSVSEEMGGGGVGYLYQHTFRPDIFMLQAGAFLGYWVFPEDPDDWDPVVAFFSPTVRIVAGYAFAFLQAGFTLHIGTSAVPAFDVGLHFKI